MIGYVKRCNFSREEIKEKVHKNAHRKVRGKRHSSDLITDNLVSVAVIYAALVRKTRGKSKCVMKASS